MNEKEKAALVEKQKADKKFAEARAARFVLDSLQLLCYLAQS